MGCFILKDIQSSTWSLQQLMLEEREEQEEKDLPSELVGDLLRTMGEHSWFRFAEIITMSLFIFLFNIYITRNIWAAPLAGSGIQSRPDFVFCKKD